MSVGGDLPPGYDDPGEAPGRQGSYLTRHLVAVRRVSEFELVVRLFGLWHLLHLPLFFLLVVTALVHVLAVHMY